MVCIVCTCAIFRAAKVGFARVYLATSCFLETRPWRWRSNWSRYCGKWNESISQTDLTLRPDIRFVGSSQCHLPNHWYSSCQAAVSLFEPKVSDHVTKILHSILAHHMSQFKSSLDMFIDVELTFCKQSFFAKAKLAFTMTDRQFHLMNLFLSWYISQRTTIRNVQTPELAHALIQRNDEMVQCSTSNIVRTNGTAEKL